MAEQDRRLPSVHLLLWPRHVGVSSFLRFVSYHRASQRRACLTVFKWCSESSVMVCTLHIIPAGMSPIIITNFRPRLAYLVFDGIIVLFISALITIIFFTSVPDSWYYLGDLFVCLFLYGVASILLSYAISLIARSQLSAFAFSAGGQAYVNSPPP